jgi:hypothetical protein
MDGMTLKPRIARRGGTWTCEAGGVRGSAETPKEAHKMWVLSLSLFYRRNERRA